MFQKFSSVTTVDRFMLLYYASCVSDGEVFFSSIRGQACMAKALEVMVVFKSNYMLPDRLGQYDKGKVA